MKKLLSALLAPALAFTLCSCGIAEMFDGMFNNGLDQDILADTGTYLEVVPDELTYSEGYEPVASAYSYEALPSEGERLLYTELLGCYYDISPELSQEAGMYPMPQVALKGYTLSEAEVRTSMKAVYDDHPEIFWASGTVGYYADDDTTIVQVYSKYSPEEVDTRVNAVRAVANAFYASVPDGLSDFDRELMAHDFIIDLTDYADDVDTEHAENNDPDIYTAYGALVNGTAVCEGYARAFQMLLNGLGLDCVGVSGYAEDELHIWNVVRLDGNWYGTDITWDDHEELYYRYGYFNLPSDRMNESHDPAPLFSELGDDEINGLTGSYNFDVMNLFIPDYTRSDMGYYRLRSAHLYDYDGAEVKSALLGAAERHDSSFVFYIDDAMDYDAAVAALFSEHPQYFFSYIETVNRYLYDDSIDGSNLGYIPLPKNRIVAVQLKYY